MDQVVLFNIFEHLTGTDVLKFLMINKRIYNFYKQFEDAIWRHKLLKKYNIDEDEIIGSCKSHFLGLELNRYIHYMLDEYHSGLLHINISIKILG